MGELRRIAARLRETAQTLRTDVDRFTVGSGGTPERPRWVAGRTAEG
jgi:hypothetical protein